MKIITDPDDENEIVISLTQEEEDAIAKALDICEEAFSKLEIIDKDAALESSFWDAIKGLEDIYQNNEVQS